VFDPIFVRLLKVPLARGAEALAPKGITANQVTWAGFAFGLLGAAAVAGGVFWLAVPLLALNRVADGLDGALARLSTPTDFGAYLDIVLDFMIYTAVAGAFAIADTENVTAAVVLMTSFMGTGASFLAWPHVFPFAAWVFALMCWVTIAQRVMSAKATFERG
jgi:phosphatidylglycerophosphate synthase